MFRIREAIRGQQVESFEAAIDPEKLGKLTTAGPIAGDGFSAMLFYAGDFPHEPAWAPYLRAGFGEGVTFPRSAAAAAVIVIRVERKKPLYLAYVFGTGRYLLRDEAVVRNFGFRAALNIMFEGDTGKGSFDPSRIRAVETKRVDRNTVRSRRQASRKDTLEVFDLDLDRDLLNGITGEPEDPKKWGPRVTGTDAIQLHVEDEVRDLGTLSRRLLGVAERKDYKARFAWIDDVTVVRDTELVGRLEAEIVNRLRTRKLQGLDLAVPEVVDWTMVVEFRFPGDGTVTRPELEINPLVISLSKRKMLEGLTVDYLKGAKIVSLDPEGKTSGDWSMWRCLTAEVSVDGKTFLLDGGEFYEVSRDYAKDLNLYLLNNLPDAEVVLPDAKHKMIEGDYNAMAAAENSKLLLLDKILVTPRKGTSRIEVCDLLSTKGELIHVKRSLGSKALSHLFAQGSVSAELLLSDDDFRKETAKGVAKVAGSRASKFPTFGAIPKPQDIEVVYAVIERWSSGEHPAHRLPFFSKVNLRRHIQDLKARGVRVSFACVNLATA